MRRKVINRLRYISTLSFKKAILKIMVAFIPNKDKRRSLLIKYDLRPTPTHYGDKFIYSGDAANEKIYELLQSEKPCLISRFGSTELSVVGYFFTHYNKSTVTYPKKVMDRFIYTSGFFPKEHAKLTRFASEILDIVPNVDLLGVWRFKDMDERDIIQAYCHPKITLVPMQDLSNTIFNSATPWIRVLANKKVLVIHPYAKTIMLQYPKRDKLFGKSGFIPEFDLKVIKAVQGIGGKDISQFNDWFEALDSMYMQIDNTDFDIAIIGAGAYGMHLGNYIKQKGKQAIHLGGSTQKLFGIKGEAYKNIMNEYWIDPLPEESVPRKNLQEFIKYEGSYSYY